MSNGEKAKIEVKNNEVYIDGAKVIITDIMAKNGVIHVIDTVKITLNCYLFLKYVKILYDLYTEHKGINK